MPLFMHPNASSYLKNTVFEENILFSVLFRVAVYIPGTSTQYIQNNCII